MIGAHGTASNYSMLRLTQMLESSGHYRVEVALDREGLRQTATSRFQFVLSNQDRDDARWYLEDYLQYPFDPAPAIAQRIEGRIREIGVELFKAVFRSSEDARDLWAILRTHLNSTRIEIITEVREATTIPWELLRDPKTDTPLALRAQAFVRAQPNSAERPQLPRASDRIRILLVICRPSGRSDVPFRSVASRLIKGLGEEVRATFDLDVLRPPTFDQLARVLRDAKDRGTPYHVVHFDGHGVYGAYNNVSRTFNQHILADHRSGNHGYLAFENPILSNNFEPVDGPTLGKLLVETNVPVLVLNACRSAHADTTEAHLIVGAATASPSATDITNPHEQVRAFGSLAQEVMDAGTAGVVAMRYNVYVVTAAQFVAELYATLRQGLSLGEAVTRGRKHLADQPLREVVSKPLPLQDWSVPIVYEAAPITLFPRPVSVANFTITLNARVYSGESRRSAVIQPRSAYGLPLDVLPSWSAVTGVHRLHNGRDAAKVMASWFRQRSAGLHQSRRPAAQQE